MRAKHWIPLSLGLACGVAGCLGGTPKPSFYTLAPAPRAASEPVASLPSLGLAVGPIEFPRYLDRPELVTRDGAHGLTLSNEHRWAGSLRSDFQRVLADELGRLLGTDHVVTHPNVAQFPLDHRVLLELVAFEGPIGGPIALRARWTIVSGKTGQAVAVESSEISEPAASAAFADLVAAEGRATGRLAGEIARRIAAIAARR